MSGSSARRWAIGFGLMIAGPWVSLFLEWPVFVLTARCLPWNVGGVAISAWFAVACTVGVTGVILLPASRLIRWLILAIYGPLAAFAVPGSYLLAVALIRPVG